MSLLGDDLFTYLKAPRSILFLLYTAIYHHRVGYFSILRVGKYDPYELLIHPYRVHLPFVIGVLQHPDFRLSPHHRLVIALILPRLVPLTFLVLTLHPHLECPIIRPIRLLSPKPLHLRLEAARHSHLLLPNCLLSLIWLVATWPDFAGLLIKLRLLKR